jgi:hypothetical protein
MNMQASDKTHDEWSTLVRSYILCSYIRTDPVWPKHAHADQELQRLTMTMSPQTLSFNSPAPALAAHFMAMRAAPGPNDVHMAWQRKSM